MAILAHKCPHCLTENIALRVVAATSFPTSQFDGVLHLSCPKCHLPSGTLLKGGNVVFAALGHQDGDVLSFPFKIVGFWPAAPGPIVPDGLPPAVDRAFLSAEKNFGIEKMEEAAGMMYRRALDVGLKVIAPDVDGSLYQRIEKLVANHTLTKALGEWAHEIRLLGNESAHDEDAPSREDLTALRNFSDLVLRYLFTLPAMLEARRAAAAEKKE